ncbi:protein Niban-like isoform X2 [Parambassis ranga]|uniref:Protein Niban-like isoform X2 n=1 Tax=Parambassis ranga TaxID=210632 RepID=A0A6P7K4F5_9TELE|nr:protein Niban-like isoform X2 [Parambassis ranga]
MGASSSGLLDEAKVSHIKGLVDNTLQSFSVFYRQQYSVAYFGHLHQEVEPKKEGRGLLLTHRPQYAPEEVLYQRSLKFSCWEEQGKKSKDRYVVLRRDYKVEIHDSMETFGRGCSAKLVLQPAGASVFTTEEEFRAHLEKTCAGILNGVKEESSSVVSSPDVFAVYLHLPYTGHTCFLFQQEEERDHFLSGLKTCIRHCNLDPWCDSSHERQGYARALRLYRQEKGCYESWEMLLGSEEQVLASQVMVEVLPWLQSQLQSRVKGKKTERIRQWLATVQATYLLVLEQLTAGLEALREECRQTASANQAIIRANLDQIMSSHCFLEEKVRACICEEACKVCSECVAPYLSSILDALTENISAGILGMQETLHTQMDSTFSHTNGGTEETKKALSGLCSISLDQCYKQVEKLTEKLEDLKERFGLSSAQRLVHSAHLDMEQLLDSAVYTLEQFLQSSTRLQPSQTPVKMERAKERVLKQLDHDSRVVQRRLYQEALLEITLPCLTRRMDSSRKTELQQLEQYIFSDYSSFILVHNVYEDVLRNILSKEIETVVQEAASKKSNNLLLDTSDLAISQYSLLGQTPPRSAQGSPAIQPRHSSSAEPSDSQPNAPVVKDGGQVAEVCPQSGPDHDADTTSEAGTTESSEQAAALLSPVIVVTQQFDEHGGTEETSEEVQTGTDAPSTSEESTGTDAPSTSEESTGTDAPSTSEESTGVDAPSTPEDSSRCDASVTHEADTPDPLAETKSVVPDSPDPISSQSTEVQPACTQSDQYTAPENQAVPEPSDSDQISEEASSIQPPSPSHTPGADSPVKMSLGSLSEAIGCSPTVPTVAQQTTDRAVYLTGQIKDNWEVERVKEAARRQETEANEDGGEKTEGEKTAEETEDRQIEGVTHSEAGDEVCPSPVSPAENALTSEQQEVANNEVSGGEIRREEEEAAEKDHPEEETAKDEIPQSSQPMESQPESDEELPLDSVSIIRELVSEVIEVETTVPSCPNGSSTP